MSLKYAVTRGSHLGRVVDRGVAVALESAPGFPERYTYPSWQLLALTIYHIRVALNIDDMTIIRQ
jgi:hypothetical protein